MTPRDLEILAMQIVDTVNNKVGTSVAVRQDSNDFLFDKVRDMLEKAIGDIQAPEYLPVHVRLNVIEKNMESLVARLDKLEKPTGDPIGVQHKQNSKTVIIPAPDICRCNTCLKGFQTKSGFDLHACGQSSL